ncbi:hypothetical protein EZV62_003832 [Acer yangbiense]|uniref:DUF4219 domain-containing protein n=1 Tax=Acer yangbiense TaxID=1000413 RepID=A0A5C7IHU0_9ROSI|nr:hypothetical protein EZV62_003832 [Acer yangbiense]
MSADMAAGSNAGLHVPQFFGENYQIWTVKMKSYLKAFGLWEYAAEDKQVPLLRANPTIAQMKQHEEEKMKKDKAVTCLHSALSDSVFTSIMHLETSKSIWDELKSRFEGSERVKSVKLLTLKREFENLKMKDSETVKDYSSKLSELVNQMRLYGDVVEDYKVVEKMLVSLPDKFEAKVAAIEESCDLRALTVSEMVSKLQAQEQRLALRNDGDMEEAFLAMNKGKHKGKGNQKKTGFNNKNGDKKAKARWMQQVQNLVQEQDFHHVPPVREQTILQRIAGTRGNHKFNAHSARNGDTKNNTAEPSKVNKLNSLCNKLTILMINGCTSHMARNEGMFTTLSRNATTTMKLGNGDTVKAAGRDSKKSEIVRVKMYDNSFPIDFNQVKQKALISKHDESDLWHKRLGHFNFDALNYIQKNGMIEGLPDLYRIEEKRLPKQFWAEAVYASVYILNRLSTKAVIDATPMEAWSGSKPTVKHLKVFGSICYMHVPNAKRTKLDNKAEMGILLGCAMNSKAYRVYNLETKKISVCRDIKIDENAHWNWEKNVV